MKNWVGRALILGFSTLAIIGLATPDGFTLADLRKIIEERNQAYLKALLDGDSEGFAALFTQDATTLFPGQYVKGNRQIRERQRAVNAGARVFDGAIETLDLELSGDMAYEIGKFRYVIGDPQGKAKRTVTGKFLVIWKRDTDGQWRIHVDSGFPDPINP